MSIEAMELALEALEQMYCCYANPKFISHKQQETQIIEQTKDAMVALRQSIEQAQKQETDEVGTGCECPNCANGMGLCHTVETQAQKQEPVAAVQHWCTYCQGHNAHNCQFNTQLPRVHTYTTNHTSPPQRQPLTDEEIQKCYETTGHYQTLRPQDRFAVFALARAIEAKLKEKNI